MRRLFFIFNVCLFFLSLPSAYCENKEYQELKSERFGTLRIYSPAGEPKNAVVFFSGEKGWNPYTDLLLHRRKAAGDFVIAVDTPEYLHEMEDDEVDCEYIAGEIERLSQSAQQSQHVPVYHPPVLAALGGGGILATAALAQAPDPFRGAVLLAPPPALKMSRPLCAESFLKSEHDEKSGVTKVSTDANLPRPLVALPKPPLMKAFDEALQKVPEVSIEKNRPTDGSLTDLPLLEIPPAEPVKDYFVIFYSGDGGWATIDGKVGDFLSAEGIPVVGVNSLKYFWSERSAEDSARDLDRIIESYSTKFRTKQILLGGFSMGADVVPVIYNGLKPKNKKLIHGFLLLSPSEHALLEVQISDWLGLSSEDEGAPLKPEMEKLSGKVLCLYGEDDDENICEHLDPKKFELRSLPGDHHFDGDYEALTKVISEFLKSITWD